MLNLLFHTFFTNLTFTIHVQYIIQFFQVHLNARIFQSILSSSFLITFLPPLSIPYFFFFTRLSAKQMQIFICILCSHYSVYYSHCQDVL